MLNHKLRRAFANHAVAALLALLGFKVNLQAQHLWWDGTGRDKDTHMYGQITVLETYTYTYFCGANWHPGEPAGGYCGIQNNDTPEMRKTIFSIWDTNTKLWSKITYKSPELDIAQRFGGEGEGAQTLMNLPWVVSETFHFYLKKEQAKGGMTDTTYYIYDSKVTNEWKKLATISNPNGKFSSVKTLTSICSFLENYGGMDAEVPRLALYRLWSGRSVKTLTPMTRSAGDGTWGTMGGAFFLASGSTESLNAAYVKWTPTYGAPQVGTDSVTMEIPAGSIDPHILLKLKSLKK